MLVEVVRSPRRRKTVELRPTAEGVVQITMPARISIAEERHWIATLLRNYKRKAERPAVDLTARTRLLSREYDLARPRSIKWVNNQHKRWGSCTPSTGAIRISSELTRFPSWVIDYVLIHEMAHLHVRGHNNAFWKIVNRYPLAERARGFLIAKGMDEQQSDEDSDVSFDTAYASSSS